MRDAISEIVLRGRMAEGDEWNEFDTQQLLENGMISADCGILQAAASSRRSFILARCAEPRQAVM